MIVILITFVFRLFCSEDKHRYEEAFNESMEKFIKRQQVSKQIDSLKFVYDMYANQSHVKQNVRYDLYYFHLYVFMVSYVDMFLWDANIVFIYEHTKWEMIRLLKFRKKGTLK